MRIRFKRGEDREVMRLLQHVQREHTKEPGVAEALFRVLYEYGLIDEHGRQVVRCVAASPLIVPGAAASGKILVPGGETAAAGELEAGDLDSRYGLNSWTRLPHLGIRQHCRQMNSTYGT